MCWIRVAVSEEKTDVRMRKKQKWSDRHPGEEESGVEKT